MDKTIVYLGLLIMTAANASRYYECCIEDQRTNNSYCAQNCDASISSEDGSYKILKVTIPKVIEDDGSTWPNQFASLIKPDAGLGCQPTPTPYHSEPPRRPFCPSNSPDCCTHPHCHE